jgi:hypothetical protein
VRPFAAPLWKYSPSQPRDDHGRFVDWRTVASTNDGFGLAAGQVEAYVERVMGASPDQLSWSVERLSVTHAADGVLENHVAHLADKYRAGGEKALPPVVAIERPDGRLERVDGNHRLNAAKIAGLSDLPAFIGRLKVEKFNPSQPRDERGRWTDGGATHSPSGPRQRLFGHEGIDVDGKQGIGVEANTGDTRSPEQRHEDAWRDREVYEPDPRGAAVAANYRASQGLPEPSFGGDLNDIPADLGRARQVASIAMLNNGEITLETRVAYLDLVRQTGMQLDAMKRAGVKVEYLTKADIIERGLDPDGLNPYPTARAQRDDIVHNGRLMVASLVDYPESYHPLLDSSQGGTYDQFRAVHDYFGHAAVGTGFDRHGEFQAWLHHTSMFTGEGRKAASSELHVENSFLATTGGSAPHFATLLPDDMVDPFMDDGTYKGQQWLTGLDDQT